MLVVRADLDACQGYANCVVVAPEAFDIGDEGVVVVKMATVDEEDRATVEEAVRSCPVAALSIEEA